MPLNVSTAVSSIPTLDQLCLCGQAQAFSMQWELRPDPYTTVTSLPAVPPELTLISGNINRMNIAEFVVLHSVEFNVYDQTQINEADPDPGLVAIRDSLSKENDAYPQTPFVGTQMYDFQPNFLRPRFLVNGIDVLGETSNTTGTNTGLPIPYEKVLNRSFGKVDPKGIKVFAHCAQKIDMGVGNPSRYALYQIMVLANFYLIFANPTIELPSIFDPRTSLGR